MPRNISRMIRIRVSESELEALTAAVKTYRETVGDNPRSTMQQKRSQRTLEGLWRRLQGHLYAALDGDDLQ